MSDKLRTAHEISGAPEGQPHDPSWWRNMILPDKAAPAWSAKSVPLCSHESCPHYDGKRCALIGAPPPDICAPTVENMAALLAAGVLLFA